MNGRAPEPVVLIDNGDHSHTSRGDGAMLAAAVESLRDSWPRAAFAVVSASPARLRLIDPSLHALPEDRPDLWRIDARPAAARRLSDRVLDLWWGATGRWLAGRSWRQALRRRGLPARLDELRPGHQLPGLAAAPLRPALTVASGGGYFCDMDAERAISVLDTLEWAAARGSVTALASQGIGPITDPALRRRMAEVLPRVDLILLRERLIGPDLLAKLGVPLEKVAPVGDDAIVRAWAPRALSRRGRIGVSLRSAQYLELHERDTDAVCSAVASAAAWLKAAVRPFAACEWRNEDRRANQALAGRVHHLEPDLRPSASPQDFAAGIGTCRVVVTMTYHAAVFALSQGIPAVCAYRSTYHRSKLVGLADLFGGEGVTLVDLHDAGARASLPAVIAAAWHSADGVADRLRARANQIREDILRSYRRLADLVESAEAHPRPGLAVGA